MGYENFKKFQKFKFLNREQDFEVRIENKKFES